MRPAVSGGLSTADRRDRISGRCPYNSGNGISCLCAHLTPACAAKATAPSPKCCGLVVKAGIVDLTRDDRAMIYGAMLWIADKLKREGGEHARDTWTKLGKMAFEMERPAGAHTTEK